MIGQVIGLGLVVVVLLGVGKADEPIRLDRENPHYLSFRGRPAILVGSGEHYGAVLNLDFDHGPYLEALSKAGLNLTRTFSGTYREVPGSFQIEKNTLAPAPNRYQAPWKKVAEAGDGKVERYDLDQFDPAYFERLEAFVIGTNEANVVVELVLFCPFYEQELWDVNPMNAKNNVNGIGECLREEVYTLKHPELLKRQLAFVREVVKRMNGYDNLYFEICNEPYFGGVTLDWQRRIAEEIVEVEKGLPKKHLIAQNIANEKQKVDEPVHHEVDILNFHYAEPQAALENYGLDRALGDDETGFDGTGDRTYRTEAWRFLLSGGSIFSHLDYSFTVDDEDGTAVIREPTPGGGGPRLRSQLALMKRTIEGLDFLKMKPEPGVIGRLPEGARGVALVEAGRQYLIHVDGGGGGGGEWMVAIPDGEYRVSWIDPRMGWSLGEGVLSVQVEPGSTIPMTPPGYAEDVVLRLIRNDVAGFNSDKE